VTGDRYERERSFHNEQTDRWQRVSKFYDVTATSQGYYQSLLEHDCEGKRILEYGCGEGSSAFSLAELGASVTGIDISDRRIESARQTAASLGLQGLTFEVMNAEELEFADASFDLICGTGIIHHLDLERAYSELARTLKPSGEAVFLEPLGHNPLINLYRRLTPRLRTEDEHPLRTADLKLARRYFDHTDVRFFHLTSLAAVPFRATRAFPGLLRSLDRLDQRLIGAIPALGPYAWTAVMRLASPRRTTAVEEPGAVAAA
jgi:ubiquinone/menaquinone biosynthesis C-methylase UbiE